MVLAALRRLVPGGVGELLKGAFATDGKKSVVKILDIAELIGAAFVQEERVRPRRASGELRSRMIAKADLSTSIVACTRPKP